MSLTEYLGIVAMSLATIAVVVVSVWLFIRSTERKTFPIACMLVGFVLEAFFGVRQPYVTLGLQIYPNDVISLFLFASTAGAVLLRRIPLGDGVFLAWNAFGAMAWLSFVFGVLEFGKYAGTEFRPFFYLWIAGTYCAIANFDENDLRRIGRWCLWAAYAFVALAVYFWIGVELGVVDRRATFGDTVSSAFRPIGSHATFFVAVVAMFQLMAWLRGSGTERAGLHAGLLLVFVIVMQHRSVWIAALVGLFGVFVLERQHLGKRLPLIGGAMLVVAPILAIGVWAGLFDSLIDRLVESTVSMLDSRGTFAARVDGWERLIEMWTDASNTAIAIGLPFGYGYVRLYNGQFIEFAPHNWFIDLVLRVGVVGLVFYVWAALAAMVRALRAEAGSEFERVLLRGLGLALLAALVYCLAYPSYYLIGAMIGVVAGHLASRGRLQKAAAPVAPAVPPAAPPQRPRWQRPIR